MERQLHLKIACSLYALGFGAYFEHVFNELGVAIPHGEFFSPQKLLAATVAVLFAHINFRGASETGKIGNLVTLAKIAILDNIAFLILFLIFLDDAMTTWRLTVLSDFLKQGIFFFPKATTCLIIFGLGWLISSWAATAIRKGRANEQIPPSAGAQREKTQRTVGQALTGNQPLEGQKY